MEIYYDTKNKILAFLEEMQEQGHLEEENKHELQNILKEVEPFRKTLSAIHRTLLHSIREKIARAGARTEKGAGVAAKLDSLVVALYGFAILFTCSALIPVFYIYRQYAWLVPVLLIVPLWHLYASRILAGRLGDRKRAAASHVKAGVFFIIPLILAYIFVRVVFEISPPFLVVPVVWLGYTTVLYLRIRTDGSRFLLLWTGAICANVLLMSGDWASFGSVLLAGNAFIAMFLMLVSHLRIGEAGGDFAEKCRWMAMFFLFYSLVLACVGWVNRSGANAGAFSAPAVAYFLSLPLFLAIFRRECRRVAARSGKMLYLVNLAAAWLYAAAVLYGLDFAGRRTEMGVGLADGIFIGGTYLLVFSWFLWMLLDLFGDMERFHEECFGAGAAGMALCCLALFIVLFKLGWWPAALVLGLVLMSRMRALTAAVKRKGEDAALKAIDG